MNTSNETTKAAVAETPLIKDIVSVARYYLGRATDWARWYLGGRRGLILLAAAALGAGAVLNWGWLVAIGVAPILLTLAPCAAMCALGLCMNKMAGGKSCSTDQGAGHGPNQIAGPRSGPPSAAQKTESDLV